MSSPVILGLVKTAAPEIVKLLESLDPAQILAIINAILDVTQSPTEIYWTFKEYAGKITKTFVYPKGITAKEADEAVENLDKLVQNIFPLLKDLGVLDAEDLPTVVNGLLFTNANLTKLTTTVYGGIYSAAKKADVTALLKSLGLDFSPKGVANILMDSSYGKTYSSAAKTLKKAKSWSKVKKLNWGFKDGSSKAQTGFVNALAALLRPVNDILSVFLAEGKGLDINLDAKSKAELLKMVKNINVKKSEIGGIKDTDPYGCKIYLEIKNGVLILTVDSKASDKNSTFKLDINGVAATLIEMDSDAEAGFGTNGYENAVIPLLEAFLCDDVVTYDEYISDYEDAKDNLIIDVLNPIVGLVNKVLEAPGSTLTAILPNLAYFIDSNGFRNSLFVCDMNTRRPYITCQTLVNRNLCLIGGKNFTAFVDKTSSDCDCHIIQHFFESFTHGLINALYNRNNQVGIEITVVKVDTRLCKSLFNSVCGCITNEWSWANLIIKPIFDDGSL